MSVRFPPILLPPALKRYRGIVFTKQEDRMLPEKNITLMNLERFEAEMGK